MLFALYRTNNVFHIVLLFFYFSDNDGILDIDEKGSADCCAPLVGKTAYLVDTDKNGVPDYRQKAEKNSVPPPGGGGNIIGG